MLAEFASHEFSQLEFLRDGKIYADIIGVGSAEFAGAGSMGKFAEITAAASLGVSETTSPAPIAGIDAAMSQVFAAVPDITALADLTSQGLFRFGAVGSGGKAVWIEASALWEFDGTAEPQVGHEGMASWTWQGGGVMGAERKFHADATWRFGGLGNMTAMANVRASATWAWGHLGRMTTARAGHGSTQWRFSSLGKMGRAWAIGASTTLEFAGVVAMRAVPNMRPAAQMTFVATGDAYLGVARAMQPQGQMQFAGVVDLSATKVTHGEAAWAWAAHAVMGTFANLRPAGELRFDAEGKPGGHLYPSLPPAREGFVVPADPDAFVVPQDIEMEEV